MNGTPFHAIGDFLRTMLQQVPLSTVRWLFIACLVAVLVLVLRLPSNQARSDVGSGRWDENLKIWATLALLIQIAIYILL